MNPLASITIKGEPLTYRAKGQGQIRSELKSEARRQFNAEKFKGPICMDIIFYISPPKHLYHDVKMGKIIHPVQIVGQVDSMTHLVCKYLRNVAFSDPAQIVDLRTRKIYDLNPRTDIALFKPPI